MLRREDMLKKLLIILLSCVFLAGGAGSVTADNSVQPKSDTQLEIEKYNAYTELNNWVNGWLIMIGTAGRFSVLPSQV